MFFSPSFKMELKLVSVPCPCWQHIYQHLRRAQIQKLISYITPKNLHAASVHVRISYLALTLCVCVCVVGICVYD